jgi:hypothetical protein
MLVNNYKSKQHNIPKSYQPFKKVAKLKNLGITLPNQNCIEEMKSRLNFGNSSFTPVHSLLPSLYLKS